TCRRPAHRAITAEVRLLERRRLRPAVSRRVTARQPDRGRVPPDLCVLETQKPVPVICDTTSPAGTCSMTCAVAASLPVARLPIRFHAGKAANAGTCELHLSLLWHIRLTWLCPHRRTGSFRPSERCSRRSH